MASHHHDEPFRDKNCKQKIGTIVGMTLFILFILGFVLGIYFFGVAGIFTLLGIEYTSVWSLIIFVVILIILSAIVELFSEPIFRLIAGKITGTFAVLCIQFGIQSLTNWLCLFTIAEFMESVHLTQEAGIIVAMLLALIEMTIEAKERKKD